MKQHSIPNFLNELVAVFLHNLIYYIPSELIFHGVLDQLEGELPDNFFDELSLLDINKGIYSFINKDGLEISQKIFEKRSLLENNLFLLIEKNKEVRFIEFQIIIERYFDQLIFYLFITDWLITNFKKYNEEDSNRSLIGVFKLQHENLSVHLKDFYRYFGALVDINIAHDFSIEKLVMEHFPDLVTRYHQISNKNALKNEHKTKTERENEEPVEQKDKQQPKKKPTSKKKQRPNILDTEIEKLVLERVFKVKID